MSDMTHTNTRERLWVVIRLGYTGTHHNLSTKCCQASVHELATGAIGLCKDRVFTVLIENEPNLNTREVSILRIFHSMVTARWEYAWLEVG